MIASAVDSLYRGRTFSYSLHHPDKSGKIIREDGSRGEEMKRRVIKSGIYTAKFIKKKWVRKYKMESNKMR